MAGDLRYEWVRMSLYESKLGGTGIESGRINKGRLDPILAFLLTLAGLGKVFFADKVRER